MSNRQAKVHVRITVEVDADGPWGEDCSVGQTWEQGARSAMSHLDQLIKSNAAHGRVRLIGKPKVTTVIVEEN